MKDEGHHQGHFTSQPQIVHSSVIQEVLQDPLLLYQQPKEQLLPLNS